MCAEAPLKAHVASIFDGFRCISLQEWLLRRIYERLSASDALALRASSKGAFEAGSEGSFLLAGLEKVAAARPWNGDGQPFRARTRHGFGVTF